MELTPDAGTWDVTLRTGEVLKVLAHSVSEEEGQHVFWLLMRGRPHFDVAVLRVPSSLVAEIYGPH